jgi:hypothetical protein
MELAERFAVSITKQLTTLGANRAALREYLTAEFAKVPSAPVEAAQSDVGRAMPDITEGGWCSHCGCGNDTNGYAHLPACRRPTTPPQAEPDEIARLAEELADEKAVVDCLRSELADRLQKQRAAEAELQEVRKDAPAGMRLVPIEPTEAMHQAAVRTIVRCTGNADFPPRVWRAMLTAAPEATNGRPE